MLYGAVEVGLEEPVLNDAIFFKFRFGEGLGNFGRDFAWVVKNLPLIELEEGVEFLRPILHGHRNLPLSLILGIIQIHRHNPVKRLQFLFREIVFGDKHIWLEDFSLRSVFPRGQPHMLLLAVRTFYYQFRGGMAVNRKVQLVLNGRKEILCDFCIGPIIHRRRVDVGNLLVEPSLARANLADFR